MLRMKDDNKINERYLDIKESQCFIWFLEKEIFRHRHAIRECQVMLNVASTQVLKVAWTSSLQRHEDDIFQTEKTIFYLKQKWSI